MSSIRAQSTTYQVKGEILDRESDDPVKGALVFLDEFPDISGISDSKGEFKLFIPQIEFNKLQGVLNLEVEARSYQSKSVEIKVRGNGPSIDAGTIKLKKSSNSSQNDLPGTLSEISFIGILLDVRSRAPISTAVNFELNISGKISAKMEESGVFTITIPEERFQASGGSFNLQINAEGYGTNVIQASFSPGRQFYDLGVLTLDPSAIVLAPISGPHPGVSSPGSESDENALYNIQAAYNTLKQGEINNKFDDPKGLQLLEELFDQYEADISKDYLKVLADNRREKYHRVLSGMDNYRDEYLSRSARMLRHNLEGYDLDYLKSDVFEEIMTNLGETLSYLRQFFKSQDNNLTVEKVQEIDDYLYIINKYFNM